MADYAPLISRAIDALTDNTGEARRAIYERARQALVSQLRMMDPPLKEDDITRERLALEEAIRRIENDNAAKEAIAAALDSHEGKLFGKHDQPVSVIGAPAVHDVARAAESLGSAPDEARRSAHDMRDALGEADSDIPPEAHVEPLSPVKPEEAPHAHNWTADNPEQVLAPLQPISRQEPGFGLTRRKRRGHWIWLLLFLAVLAAGAYGGYWVLKRRTLPASSPGAESAGPMSQADRPKSSDRLHQPPATVPREEEPAAAPPATAAPPQNETPQSAINQGQSESAILLEETPAGQSPDMLAGSVNWRIEQLANVPGQPPETTVRADIEVPARRMFITLTFKKNAEPGASTSHMIELLFRVPRDFPHGGIANVPGLLAKLNEQSRGQPLSGQSIRVMNGFFMIGLSGIDIDRDNNLTLLHERAWLDIPIEFDNRRRAILSLEKGASGQKVIDEALRAWGDIQ